MAVRTASMTWLRKMSRVAGGNTRSHSCVG
jgi:hypothetical protein